MSIINRVVIDDSAKVDSRVIVADYFIHTGEVLRKRFHIGLTDDVAVKVSEKDASVLAEMENREVDVILSDVFDGKVAPIDIPESVHTTTTVNDTRNKIIRAILKEAFSNRDPYLILACVALLDSLLQQYTATQIKNALDLTDAQFVKVRDRYLHVKNNIAVYQADVYGEL